MSDSIRSYIHQEFERLKQTSPVLFSLIETTSYGFAVITTDYHLVEVNSRMLELFPGIDVSQYPACYRCLYGQTDTQCRGCPAERCLSTGTKETAHIETPEGQPYSCYKVSCTPLTDAQGSVWGILEIAEDVTTTMAREQELREIATQRRQILDNANDAIIAFNQDGIIVKMNKKAVQLTGYAREELEGENVYILVPEEKRKHQQEMLRELCSHPADPYTSRVIEGECLRRDGSIVPIEETVSILKTAQGYVFTSIIRDVSERKMYERQLKSHAEVLEKEVVDRTRQLSRSERRYHSLVETANEAIISADQEGRIRFFNRKAEQIYGYEREDILGCHMTDIAPQEIWDAMRKEFEREGNALDGTVVESIGITRDKTTLPVEYTLSAFKYDGEFNVTCLARDITRRKNLELEVQEYTAKLEEKVRGRTYELTASQESLREKVVELSILKEISEVLASTTELDEVLNTILIGVTSHQGFGFNRAFVFLISEDGGFLEGKLAVGPSDQQEAQHIWGEILGKNMTLKEMLNSYTSRAGTVDTHVNTIVKGVRVPLTDDNDVLIQAIKSKSSLNVMDAKSHPAVPESLTGMMHCNAFVLIPLIAEDNVLGLLWADNAITGKPIEQRDIEQLRSFAVQASLAIEKSNLYKNFQDKVEQLDAANREIMEKRNQLIRTEKLAAVGQMSATVAHGIRNPLVSIGGFARRLLKKEDPDSPSRKYLNIIIEEINRLETMLSELLDFVRPRKMSQRNVSLLEVVETTLQFFSYEFEQRSISVEQHKPDDPLMLEIDVDQFKRVLHNLFYNAIEAMPEGGTLSIDLAREDPWARLSIADTGSGVDNDNVEKIFHPFFSSKPTGSGLGLAVCNQIISIHGGNIKLRRHLPHGAIFDIYLPLLREQAAEAPV